MLCPAASEARCSIAAVKGPPITVRCDCGELERVPYGEAWICPSCGRRWDTSQIPSEEYWGIMREMRRYRLEVIAVSVVLGIVLAITLANLGSRRYFPIVLGVMGFWFLIYMPRWRRKVRARARQLPNWKLRSG
jgi:hypothetical protein